MLGRIGTAVSLLVRAAAVIGVAYLVTLLTTALRDDEVGLAVGVVFGLAFGVLLVHVDFARLRHDDRYDDRNR